MTAQTLHLRLAPGLILRFATKTFPASSLSLVQPANFHQWSLHKTPVLHTLFMGIHFSAAVLLDLNPA